MRIALLFIIISFNCFHLFSQVIPNGMIDNLDEMYQRETYYVPMSDGTMLATDIALPVLQDSVVTEVEIDNVTYTLMILPKGAQYIVYDTSNFSKESYRLPLIFTRTPYNKNSDDVGSSIFPFMGYGYVIQDMRGRYGSEGVYFPMFSDSWAKEDYPPNVSIPMDVTLPSDPRHALKHKDGYDGLFYLEDSLERITDLDFDGVNDTIPFSNGSIGMFGASALGNSQYQLLSSIPHSENSPIKCIMPIVAANEHYNSTLFHNGVYRRSLSSGWITGQIDSGLDNSLNASDNSIDNTIHSPSDYNYVNKDNLAQDLIDWFVSSDLGVSPSGAHPTSTARKVLDASFAPVDTDGNSNPNGNYSRYTNLNKPAYHLTGWWDIFINGQIETFNNTRKARPDVMQRLIIGPWTHQTIGANHVGDETYPDNVFDVMNFDFNFNPANLMSDPNIVSDVYQSELLMWFRSHLGGEPFFFIPESDTWQPLGSANIKIPSENYAVPYYQFLNYLAGLSTLEDVPVIIADNVDTLIISYDLPVMDNPLLTMTSPLQSNDTSYFENQKEVKMYISGPTNDPSNSNVGNYWLEYDSLPFYKNIINKELYLHQDYTVDGTPPVNNEGTRSYIADPDNPVVTIGGNNMIPDVPNGTQKSQGSMNLANPSYAPVTMNRPDVLAFETAPLADTMTVVGFPKAGFYVKGNTTTHNTSKTDFDVMVRILDVYPDGREMLITEGVVNARARDYALSITESDTNDNILLTNVDNNTFYYMEFDCLPLGHTFGAGHQVKFLVSSSNYPKYQSNPHLPNEDNEFFRWEPGQATTYSYQGNNLTPQSAEITYEFRLDFPTYISLPELTASLSELEEEKISSVNQAKVYPNPAFDQITIDVDSGYIGDIQITDMNGRLVLQKTISELQKEIKLNIGFLPNGVYNIILVDEKSTARWIKN